MTSLNATPPTVPDTFTFTYDGSGRRVGIVESHGSTVLTSKTFVWCGSQLCQQRDSTGHTVTNQFFTYGEQINGTNYYFTRDRLGSVREMTDSSGNIQANYDYDPWGRQTQIAGTLSADFGFTGFYMEKAAGLDLTWYRAYDPEKGGWLSRDPKGESAGINLYAYAGNNPIEFTDPSGLSVPSGPQPPSNPPPPMSPLPPPAQPLPPPYTPIPSPDQWAYIGGDVISVPVISGCLSYYVKCHFLHGIFPVDSGWLGPVAKPPGGFTPWGLKQFCETSGIDTVR